MSIQYTTVYQISQRMPDWPFVCIGLLPILAGAAILWSKRRFSWPVPNSFFAVFCCGFGILWISLTATLVLPADWRAFAAYQQGDYTTVMGVVHDFHPMPYEGHQDECFSVQDQRFCYSDFDVAPGFHRTASHGGPIREGLPVQVAFHDGIILRLEVASNRAPTPAQSAAATVEAERQWQEQINKDPFQREMNAAFLFAAVCWTLWWNLQWKLAMRFWVRPPCRRPTEVLFRAFFAFSLVGAVIGLGRQILAYPLSGHEIVTAAQIAVLVCGVVAAMSVFALFWRRDRETT